MDKGISYEALPLWLTLFCYGVAGLQIVLCLWAIKSQPVLLLVFGPAGALIVTTLLFSIAASLKGPRPGLWLAIVLAIFAILSGAWLALQVKSKVIFASLYAGAALSVYMLALALEGLHDESVPIGFLFFPTIAACFVAWLVGKGAIACWRLVRKTKA